MWDERRDLVVPGDAETTLEFCTEHWLKIGNQSIDDHGAFYVALSGGSTPKAIFQMLTSPTHAHRIDWSKVHLFWSDERAVDLKQTSIQEEFIQDLNKYCELKSPY